MRKKSTIATKPPFYCHAIFEPAEGEDGVLFLHAWDGKYPSAKVALIDTMEGRQWVRHGDYLVMEFPWDKRGIDDYAEDLGGRKYRLKPGIEAEVRFETVTIVDGDLKRKKTA